MNPNFRLPLLLLLTFSLAPNSLAQKAATPTFTKDVAPILQKHCQGCHRPGEAAPFSLLTYEQARPWAKAMKEAVLLKKMPPWFADPHYGKFSNERSLSQNDVDTLAAWADAGAPEGDPRDMPRAYGIRGGLGHLQAGRGVRVSARVRRFRPPAPSSIRKSSCPLDSPKTNGYSLPKRVRTIAPTYIT